MYFKVNIDGFSVKNQSANVLIVLVAPGGLKPDAFMLWLLINLCHLVPCTLLNGLVVTDTYYQHEINWKRSLNCCQNYVPQNPQCELKLVACVLALSLPWVPPYDVGGHCIDLFQQCIVQSVLPSWSADQSAVLGTLWFWGCKLVSQCASNWLTLPSCPDHSLTLKMRIAVAVIQMACRKKQLCNEYNMLRFTCGNIFFPDRIQLIL